jgi:phospholipid/cholesterol/gamma-HCH transport system permease protein
MDTPAEVTIEKRPEGSVAVLTGDWTATELGDAVEGLRDVMQGQPELKLDMRGIGRCDTSGAFAILEAARDRLPREQIAARPEIARLLELVDRASQAEPTPKAARRPALAMFDRIGHGLINVGFDFYDTMAFNGRLIVTTGRALMNPRRIRWAAVFSLVERAGLDAIPIVAVTTFFIGAVVAFIGANMLSDFGAQVFAVELIGIAVLREFGIVITAVLLAGRSASSFAAEIGSMKMSQEIDAMQVLGVDPFEALVLPRFLALLFTIPLLTFVAMLAGLFGGLIVCWSSLDLSPSFFVQRLVANVGAHQFWIGMSKAPVLAIVIAAIGCRQGMEVGGDVESLGRRVTAAVVHAIFSIILIDAVFALIYMELNQ